MQLRGDNSGVVKDLRFANADSEGRSDLLLRQFVLRVAAKRPGISIQGIHIVASGDFEPGDAKCFGGILASPEIVKDEMFVCVVAGVDQRASICYEVAVSPIGFWGLTGAIKSLRQRKAARDSWKVLITLAEQFHGFGIMLPG